MEFTQEKIVPVVCIVIGIIAALAYQRYNGFIVSEKMFPTALIVIDVLAAIVYFLSGDTRNGFYWLFAAGLSYCVVYQ